MFSTPSILQEELVYKVKKERQSWVLAFDAAGAEEHCLNENNCLEADNAKESDRGCLYCDLFCWTNLHAYLEEHKTYRMRSESELSN